MTCSQLSTMSRASVSRSRVTMLPRRVWPGSSLTARSSATVGTTRSGWPIGASWTSHTPPPYLPDACVPARRARRLFPEPPGPVSVSNRDSRSSSSIVSSSASRPMNEVVSVGNPGSGAVPRGCAAACVSPPECPGAVTVAASPPAGPVAAVPVAPGPALARPALPVAFAKPGLPGSACPRSAPPAAGGAPAAVPGGAPVVAVPGGVMAAGVPGGAPAISGEAPVVPGGALAVPGRALTAPAGAPAGPCGAAVPVAAGGRQSHATDAAGVGHLRGRAAERPGS